MNLGLCYQIEILLPQPAIIFSSTYNDVNLSIKTAPDAIVAQFLPCKDLWLCGNFYHDNNLILCSLLASVCTAVWMRIVIVYV